MQRRTTPFDITAGTIASALLAFALIPYDIVKSISNQLAPDGNFERLSETNLTNFRLISVLISGFLAAIVLWGLFNKISRDKFMYGIKRLPGRFVAGIKPFRTDCTAFLNDIPGWAKTALSIIVISGSLLRILMSDRPLLHDESYTIAAWGRADLLWAISDYHLPNNHLFNSALVNLIYHLGGRSAWMMRLPVFICGVLLIIFVFLLGKILYNDLAGVFAAGFTAFSPFLVSYSVNARGYEIQALLTVMTIILSLYCVKKKNIFVWSLFILLSSLNFFTLPTSLYPFGSICLWILLNIIFFKKGTGEYSCKWQLLKYLFFAGLAVITLTCVLYVPLLIRSGCNSLFHNVFVLPVPKEIFLETIKSRVKDSADIFFGSVPVSVSCTYIIGLVLSMFAARKMSRFRIPVTAAQLLWLILIVPLQRPNLWPRTLLYLHPLLLLSAAVGLSYAACKAARFQKFVIMMIYCSILAAAYPQFNNAAANFGAAGSVERAVWTILTREGKDAGDVYVAAVSEDDAPFWVYADFYGFPQKIFDRSKPFSNIYVYVNPNNDSDNGENTLEGVLISEGPGNQFIDFGSMELALDRPDGKLYFFKGNKKVIENEYGNHQ